MFCNFIWKGTKGHCIATKKKLWMAESSAKRITGLYRMYIVKVVGRKKHRHFSNLISKLIIGEVFEQSV
jgi:hypothetical protein